MYKNQLQELAQRSCFNLPSYSCLREGPDHAPRFKASVNFNGEIFESPGFCTTLRQAEHAAAEVALNALSTRGPSNSIAARILDETGVYKNLLQEVAQRVGAPLPSYTTVRTGLGHLPVFSGKVELAGVSFTGEPAKNKKQAEKNAAMAAWNCLRQLARQQQAGSSTADGESGEEQQQITTARALLGYRLRQKMTGEVQCLNFPVHPERRAPQQTPSTGSKILPLIRPTSAPRTRPPSPARGPLLPHDGTYAIRQLLQFSAAAAPPYVPLRHCATFRGGLAPPPPVTVRNSVPVFAAPPPCVPQRRPPVICPAERQVGGILPAFSAASRPLVAPRYDHPRSRPGGLVSESHRMNSGPTAARNVAPVDAANERRALTQNLGEMKI